MSYRPNVEDARAVAEADMIFIKGLGLETWFNTLIAESGTDRQVFVATNGIGPVLVECETDPHAWNALLNGVICLQNIAAATSELLPDQADDFAANAEAYIAQITTLDASTK